MSSLFFLSAVLSVCGCFLRAAAYLRTGMLLLGGSAVINALTGMNIYAAAFLIPIGIIMCKLLPCLCHAVHLH
jgi:hypothetical protein